jgi:hypothetical protein
MKFDDIDDFAASSNNPSTIIFRSEDPRVLFLIDADVLTGKLGLKSLGDHEISLEACRAQRAEIIAACHRAHVRDPSHQVALIDADFADEAPQPPTDVDGG